MKQTSLIFALISAISLSFLAKANGANSELVCEAANLKVAIETRPGTGSTDTTYVYYNSLGSVVLKIKCSNTEFYLSAAEGFTQSLTDNATGDLVNRYGANNLNGIHRHQHYAERMRLMMSLALTAKAMQKPITIIYDNSTLVGLRLE